MKIKNLKPIILASLLTVPIFCYGNSMYKLNKKSSRDVGATSIELNDNDIDNNISTTDYLYIDSSICSTTVPTTTVTTVVTEPVDEYKHLRDIEKLKNNDLSIEELDLFIKRYSSFCKISYDDSINIIRNNFESIENDYDSIRGGIMCTLFTYASDNGLLSVYTNDREIRENMTQQEKEDLIIEFCNNLNLCYDDISIVLSAFREETGNGTSYKCVNDNNYGGIRIYGEAGCNGEYGKYSTPEFGAYRQVKCISKKLNRIRNDGVSDLNSVVYCFARSYNPDYADTYSSKILNWVYDVQSDYNSFNLDDNAKQLVK